MTAPFVNLRPEQRRMLDAGTRTLHRIELPEETAARVEAGEEKRLHQEVGNYLRAAKGIRWPFHEVNSRGNPPGTLDWIFAFCRRPCAIELKTSVGRLTPEQEATIADMLADGWDVAVCRSLPEVKAFLDRIEQDAIPAAVAGPGSLAGQKTGADMGLASNASCAELEGVQ